MDRPLRLITASPVDRLARTLRHEYAHAAIVTLSRGKAPVWLNEGLAEYYSTFKITDDQKIALGTAIGNHVFLLRDSKMLSERVREELLEHFIACGHVEHVERQSGRTGRNPPRGLSPARLAGAADRAPERA